MGETSAELGHEDSAAISLESGFGLLGETDSARAVQRDTSEAPLSSPPLSLNPSFIWEYDLYFLK